MHTEVFEYSAQPQA